MIFFTCSDGQATVTSQRLQHQMKTFHAWTDVGLDGFNTELKFTIYYVYPNKTRVKVMQLICDINRLNFPQVGYQVLELQEGVCEMTYSAEKYFEGGLHLLRLFIVTFTVRFDIAAFVASLRDCYKCNKHQDYYIVTNEKYDPPMKSVKIKPRYRDVVSVYPMAQKQLLKRRNLRNVGGVAKKEVYYGVEYLTSPAPAGWSTRVLIE